MIKPRLCQLLILDKWLEKCGGLLAEVRVNSRPTLRSQNISNIWSGNSTPSNYSYNHLLLVDTTLSNLLFWVPFLTRVIFKTQKKNTRFFILNNKTWIFSEPKEISLIFLYFLFFFSFLLISGLYWTAYFLDGHSSLFTAYKWVWSSLAVPISFLENPFF